MTAKIVIAGAGPAGTSLAIRLAKKNFRVTIVERESFPREKLCGEFISPECFRHFRDLGVSEQMFAADGNLASETVFYSLSGRRLLIPSSWFMAGESALGLSRAAMDNILLNRAHSVGVEVFTGSSAVAIETRDGRAVGLRIRDRAGKTEALDADLLIDASGRTRALTKLLAKIGKRSTHTTPHQPEFVAFKAHLKNCYGDPTRCEIYSFPGGYGGLNRVEGGDANFCFIVRADSVRALKSNTADVIEQVVKKNRRAAETLRDAQPIHDWIAVAIDSFGQKNLEPFPGVFNIGDAAAFIDPFTGSGMLMALEGAELFANCVEGTSIDLEKLSVSYRRGFESTFSNRLRVSRVLSYAAYSPIAATTLVSLLSTNNAVSRLLANATRSGTRARPGTR